MKMNVMAGGKEVQVGLDRLVIGIPYPPLPKVDVLNPLSQEEVALIHANRKEFVAKLKHIVSLITDGKYLLSKEKNKDLKRYMVLSDFDDGLVCIFFLGFSFGTGVINIEVNPSRMDPDKIAEFLGLLSAMFYDHYEEVYEHGVVSHAEFYVDVSGEDISSLVLIDEGRRATTIHKGTTYHGRRKSHLVGTMYDKAKQCGEDGQRVRIEARIKRRDIRFQDLVEKDLFNPLCNFMVLERSRLQLIAQELNNPQLPNNIIELGLFGAIANKPARTAILERLKEGAVPWWQPDLFWAAHRELLQEFRPKHIQMKHA